MSHIPRLFVKHPLSTGGILPAHDAHVHYLTRVLRLRTGADVFLFNGQEGEWRAQLDVVHRKQVHFVVKDQTRPQGSEPDIHYLFAPIKHARLDYMVEKAVEMGATAMQPVLTHHTHVTRLNIPRLQANACEAAEQCGRLVVPPLFPEASLEEILATWPKERRLIWCDETAPVVSPLITLAPLRENKHHPLAVIIGPEGGFSLAERSQFSRIPDGIRLSLGLRVLRADTAAVAALAYVHAVLLD